MRVITKEISIPTDNDGFVLLKCKLCGEFFKLKPSELQADDVINIWCPICGLISDSYLTEDVIKLALKIASNIANDLIFDSLNKINSDFISFEVNKKPRSEIESPIVSKIEALEIQKYRCCKKQAKIKPLVKIFGSYCPYCGVKYDEFK
ncbi:TFIIB-type zinc ribbon-containing protein [Clostridium baratii]|uniref:TFIIB-type zinc ribbon-containing protein n=1 Tax=Clostridium baratii TaxID=1561 RepID=UPI001FA92A31|nr:TFIIB-type zinc ribbon-containing protein [Clostridium baratii]